MSDFLRPIKLLPPSQQYEILIELLVSCSGECQRLYFMALEYCLPEIAEAYNDSQKRLSEIKQALYEIFKEAI